MERTSMVTPPRSSAAGTPAGRSTGSKAGTSAGPASGSAVRAGTRTRGAASRSRAPSAGTAAPDAEATAPDSGSTSGPRLAERLTGRLQALPALATRARERLTAHRGTPPGTGTSTVATPPRPVREPRGVARGEGGTDWARVGIFGAGIAIGALLGAGTALLLAPATGFETRVRLARTARRASDRVADRVGDLGETVRRGASRGKQRVARGVVRSRWAAEDAWERRLLQARRKVARGEV
jgi:hypothetical protein